MNYLNKIVRLPITLTHLFLKKIFRVMGYNLTIKYKKIKPKKKDEKINLNIGAGGYVIDGFKSLDFYSKHYYPSKKKFLKERVEYDLRSDSIPYSDNTVDNIYISHVIEHVEEKFVVKFINESYRVLKKGGTLRIVCPDGKFLFNVSQFQNEYWNWRKVGSFSNKERYFTNWNEIQQYDYLIREVSTPNCKYYKNKINNNLNISNLKKLNFRDFKKVIVKNLVFRPEHPGDHINLHDFETLYEKGNNAGFSHILESKKLGSISIDMQEEEFDKTAPQMSLYVEMVK